MVFDADAIPLFELTGRVPGKQFFRFVVRVCD